LQILFDQTPRGGEPHLNEENHHYIIKITVETPTIHIFTLQQQLFRLLDFAMCLFISMAVND
jgi:hypothetical protein